MFMNELVKIPTKAFDFGFRSAQTLRMPDQIDPDEIACVAIHSESVDQAVACLWLRICAGAEVPEGTRIDVVLEHKRRLEEQLRATLWDYVVVLWRLIDRVGKEKRNKLAERGDWDGIATADWDTAKCKFLTLMLLLPAPFLRPRLTAVYRFLK